MTPDYLVFYLCAVFAPICPAGFRLSGAYGGSLAADAEGTIPPCRAVCERARSGCEPVMSRYNVSWPRELECARWPTQHRGVCISPASISQLSNNSGQDRSVTGFFLRFHHPLHQCYHQWRSNGVRRVGTARATNALYRQRWQCGYVTVYVSIAIYMQSTGPRVPDKKI